MKKVLVIFILIIVSCKAIPTEVNTPDPIQSNIFLFDTPNDFYKPGDILIRDIKTGGLDKLSSIDVTPLKGQTQLRNYSFDKNVTFDGILKFLGIESFPATVDIQTLRNKKIKIGFTSNDVSQFYIDDLLSLSGKIKNKNSTIIQNLSTIGINPKKQDIILLTNIYSSKDVDFSIDIGKTKNDSLKLGLEKIASLDMGYKLKDSTSLDLKIHRDSPLGFAYKRIDLGIKKGVNGTSVYIKR